MKIVLRHYQEKAIKMLRERIIAGDKNIMLWLMTGSGKSLVFKKIITDMIQNGFKVLFMVRRRDLIFQAAKKHFSHLNCSIIMGNEKGFDPDKPLQVCSIDTLQRRIKNPEYEFLKNFDFLILDEGHDTTSKKYRETLNLINYKNCIAFSATPFKIGNKVHDIFDSCVKPIEAHELRDQGFLVPARVYAPKTIDTSGIKKVAGEFHQGQLFDKVSENKIVGDIVEVWKKYGKNRPTMLFAVNIQHSQIMARAFNEANIPAIHCDQSHTKEERQSFINMLENEEIKVLCSVQTMTTGVDVPCAEVAIMARPTMSEALYVQMIGRVLRPFKICANCSNEYGGEKQCWKCGSSDLAFEKQHAVILDHANNTSRHGLPYKVREAKLEKKNKKETISDGETIKTCKTCFAIIERNKRNCPYCDSEIVTESQREIKHEDGELELVDQTPEIKKKFAKLIWRERKFAHVSTKDKFRLIHKEFGDVVFDVIEFPEWIRKEIVKDGLLQSASKVIARHNAERAKRVFTD